MVGVVGVWEGEGYQSATPLGIDRVPSCLSCLGCLFVSLMEGLNN